jgi:hypothetical protein
MVQRWRGMFGICVRDFENRKGVPEVTAILFIVGAG